MIPHSKSIGFQEAGILLLLSSGIFVLDVVAPIGVAAWLLYFLPLALTFLLPHRPAPFYYSAVVTLLVFAAHVLNPNHAVGPSGSSDLLNRVIGLTAVWGLSFVTIRYKRNRMSFKPGHPGREETSDSGRLRLESIVQSAMDAILTIDENQSIVLFNEAAELMFECRAQDAVGGPLDRFIPARFRAAHHDHIVAFGESGTTSRRMGVLGQVRALTARGEEFPVEAAISQIAVDGRKYFTVILRDLRERERLKRELEEREALLRTIIEAEPECVEVMSLDGRIQSMNAAGLAMLEAQRSEEVIGKAMVEFVMPDYRAAFNELLARAVQGQACLLEFEAVGLRGNRRWLESHAVRLPSGQGAMAGILGVTRDVTARKQAEAELRRSEERLRKAQERFQDIFESSKDAIGYVSLDGGFVLANEAFARLTGYSHDELLNKTHRDLTPPEFRDIQAQEAARVLQTGEPAEYEREYVRKDGSRVPVAVTLFLVKGDDDKPDGVAAIVRDITQRKRLQEQLRRTERVAELGTLASGMAHEIGTPMNVILGRAEYLMNRTTDEPTRKGLQTIVSQVERITRVMNQLLSFARRRPPERRPVHLKDIVEAGLEMFHERLAHHQIGVELDFEEACPPAHADGDQMSQVLINLLMNALHAMSDGGRIRIGTRRADPDMVQWTIADTGSGIPLDVLPKIFDPFFTTKEFGAGTGLGLTVVKGIMEEHGGSISVESEPGKGTTFRMLLPRSEEGSR